MAATRLLKRDHPDIAVVVLTTYADDASIADALRAGARGYLTKDAGRAEIGAAVRSAANGQAIFAAEVSDQARRRARLENGSLAPRPTSRMASSRGLSNPEIAAELFIGEATVKSHLNHAFAKIGVRNRAEAVRYGLEKGL
nr:response regulator transcription factor [Amycolatopsis oliviviridis]